MREATVTRKTAETEIAVTVALDGTGSMAARPAWASSTTCWTSCRATA